MEVRRWFGKKRMHSQNPKNDALVAPENETPPAAGYQQRTKPMSPVVYTVEGIERAISVVVPILVVAMVVNVLRFRENGGAWLAALHCALVCVLLTAYFRRNLMSPGLRLALYSLIPFFIAITGLLHWSLCGIGILLFVLSGILASMGGLRYWALVFISAVAMTLLIGAGYVSGYLVLTFDPALYVCSVTGWANALVGLVFSSLVALVWERLASDLMHRTNALEKSEGKLRAILDHQYQFTGLLNVEGRLIAANPSALKFAGATEEEVLGRYYWETPWWRHSSEMRDRVRRAIQEGVSCRSSHFQCTNCDAEGKVRTLDFSLRPVMDDAGRVVYLVPEGRDVTDLIEIQESLRSSLADLQSMFQQAAVGISYTNMDGLFIRVNRRFADMLGMEAEQIAGRCYVDFMHQDDQTRVADDLRRLRLGEEGLASGTIEARYVRTDGGVAWARITASTVRDTGGNPAYVVSIVEDITEQKKMQNALDAIVTATSHALGEKFFRSLVRQLAAVLEVRCAVVAELETGNGSTARTLAVWSDGEPGEDFQGDLAGTCYEPTLNNGMWACIENVRQRFPEDRRLAELGADSYLGTLLRDASGKPLGFLAVLDNKPFTQLRLGTALLEVFSSRAAAEMERIRAEELARLQQQQLIQADKLASLGILVAGVAHEINNPNGYIHLGIDMLEQLLQDLFAEDAGIPRDRRFSPSEARKEIAIIIGQMRDGSERIARIVTDLRDFARQGSSGMEEAVDINAVVSAAIRLVASLIKKSTDHFEAAYAEDLPPVWGNAQRLEQVVVNLLTNACQALPNRTKGIRVATRRNRSDGRVLLEVDDEGTGIASEVVSHITDPFYTTKRDRGGTGLGLSISSTIVADHGGTLSFSSELGVGTRVTLSLPAHEKAREMPHKRASEAS